MVSLQKLTVSGHSQIGDFIGQAAIQAGLNDKAVYAIQMAVDEACTNIIEHAYGGEGKGQIQLTCSIQDEGLNVTIFDQGVPFEPDQVPELDVQAPLSARRRRGMGMFFINNLVDTVEYKFNTLQGNQLILFKGRG
jgi:serine/threonine-protein kinase RsbW